MSIRIALNHHTTYHYVRPISLGPQLVRLRPAAHCRMPIRSYSLTVEPEEHFINWQQDPHGNWVARLVFPEKTTVFSMQVNLVADIEVVNPFDFFLEDEVQQFPFPYPDWLSKSLRPYLETEEQGPLFEALLADLQPKGEIGTVDFVVGVNAALQQRLDYLIRMDPGVQTPEETLKLGRGSCRDFSWLQVQLMRRLGLAARFVSGYSIQLAPDIKSLDGPSGVTQDVTDLHAWAEVYLPGGGWLGLDATSGMVAGEGYIPLACTADPGSAAPVTGGVEACESTMEVKMEVLRVDEEPRSTKPYREETWQAVLAAGDKVDETLQTGDVRLSMGGEPTFASIDDLEGDEWNTEAFGEKKREMSEELVKRLAKKFGTGGFLHYGQGKWYPGEVLPRWSLAAYWRKDGEPLWDDQDLIAETADDQGHDIAQCEALLKAIAERLGAPAKVVATYDPPEWPGAPRGDLRGYAMPLHRDLHAGWVSGNWHLHGDGVVLIPGDSPIGYRLPIDHLIDEDDAIPMYVSDPSADVPPLPKRAELTGKVEPPVKSKKDSRLRDFAIRTAISSEVRNGTLHLFLPPVEKLEYFLVMLAAVEAVVAESGLKIVIEGYGPPADYRLNVVKVTPDPGVIEVNTHPTTSWRELVEATETLYDEARLTRLGTEKFLVDGRNTGTGGGNHVVIGGISPQDSPLLRRPDLLGSMLRFWHNHPSLSYTFSGLFIGPTSQHPRVDEGRVEKIYELEIALSEVPDRDSDEQVSPWLVDRIFRHLLTDVTGNTHRTEFCIDKLYSPDSSTGRLGLLELRSFEMPPHAQMSLVQMHLIRSCIAAFWEQPYREPLMKWGTALHDRFMLHHFNREDLGRAVKYLSRAGMPIDLEWFHPHVAFRFPVYGEVVYEDIVLSIRHALEPWYTLGEEPAGGSTARFVDSSVERLEVKVRNFPSDRYAITCNGRRLPLFPTIAEGEMVAGVRYRAWQPISCLHPTLPAQTPLNFEIIDMRSQLAVAGARYHVGHPAGRNYENRPVNAKEAETRRHARFEPGGMRPGKLPIPPVEHNPLYPVTLDLRRPAPSVG